VSFHPARLNFPRKEPLDPSFCMALSAMQKEDGEVVRSIAQSSSVLILVHNDIGPPVKAILHSPMLADDFVESLLCFIRFDLDQVSVSVGSIPKAGVQQAHDRGIAVPLFR